MPDYPTILEIVKHNDAVLLTVVVFVVFSAFAVRHVAHKPLGTLNLNSDLFLAVKVLIPRQPPSLGFIIFLGLLLRLPLLGGSLWNDEAVTARLIQLPNMVPAILSDTHPPIYYLLLDAWTFLFGSNPIMLRMPSVLLSLICIYLVYRLAVGLNLSHAAGLWSAALVATLPASIQFGTEARSYMFLTMLVMHGMVAIVERDRKWFYLILALILWTHNMGALYVSGLIAACFCFNWRERRRWYLPIAVGTGLGLLWLPFLLQQSAFITDGFWTYFSVGAVARSLFNMTVGSINLFLVIPVTLISVFGIWRLRSWLRSRYGLTWLAVVLIPVLLSISISLVWQPVFVFRHFFPLMMIIVIVWGYLLSQSRLAIAVMFPVLVLALSAFYTFGMNGSRPDYRGLIAEHCSEADSFYATSINSAFLTLANDDRPTLVWSGAADNGLTITQAALPHFDMQVGNLSQLEGQTVCIMQIDRPETAYIERLVLSFFQEMYPTQTTVVHLGKWNDLVFYSVEV